MSLQARIQSINVSVDDSLLGTLALGLLEAEGLRSGPLPHEFELFGRRGLHVANGHL